MILPYVRASFDRTEVDLVLDLLSEGDAGLRDLAERRMHREGIDALLDDPRTLNALMSARGIDTAPARLVFYIVVRHALLENGIRDRGIADYLAALLLNFGLRDRAFAIDEEDAQRFYYLVDVVQAMESADGRRAFLLQAHLGNFALWLSGLFPDRIAARVDRRGAPGIEYYEQLGATGYRMAADSTDAETHGLNRIYRTCADGFPVLRIVLNRISDRYLFPQSGDPIDRLLRQVSDEVRLRSTDRPG